MARTPDGEYSQFPLASDTMNVAQSGTDSEAPLRRARAGTMPTTLSAFPLASEMYPSLTVPSSMRNRSGSFTTPPRNADAHDISTVFGNQVFTPYRPTPTTEEDIASSNMARKLASLVLDSESTSVNPAATLSSSAASLSGSSASYFSSLQEPSRVSSSSSGIGHGDGVARNRAYTVTGRTTIAADRPSFSRLAPSTMSFSPFSPQSQSSVLQQRPRAVSLGMMDGGMLDHQSLLSQGYGGPEVTSTAYQRLKPPVSRFHPPFAGSITEPEHCLRNVRSSSSLVHLENESYGCGLGRIGSHDQLSSLSESIVPQGYYSANLEGNSAISVPLSANKHLESPSSSPSQIPSRALWLGNINASLSVPDLIQFFSAYGHVDSARILSDKECAFVNFATVESAVAAKNDLELRLGSRLGGTPVSVGFGKADVDVAVALTNEAGPNAQGPTRALWVGNIPANTNPATLRTIFQQFGAIESVRVLSHKNCGFVNFEHQEDAVRARRALQNKEILGAGTGAVRIGFARAPVNIHDDSEDAGMGIRQPLANQDPYQAAQLATAKMTKTMADGPRQPQNTQTSHNAAFTSERFSIMRQLGCKSPKLKEDRVPLSYSPTIPIIPEPASDRKMDSLRLREIRKRLDSHDVSSEEFQAITMECKEHIVELCTDYIGNTVVQKLFEHCNDDTRLALLEPIAPYLATIGIHKNGTWAAQKIIGYATTPPQMQLIQKHMAPYVHLLLLDQFGNYVVQCCLHMGPDNTQFIFDAVVDKCWEIGQGRFGARSVRAMLENPCVTKKQKTYVAAAIVQNAVLLTTNANGSLLVIWYLDTFDTPGRFQTLCPRLLPYLGKLCTHKLGSATVLRVICQEEEPEARYLLLTAIFNDNSLLQEILKDVVNGVSFVQKILNLQTLATRQDIIRRVRECLVHQLHVSHVPSYQKFLKELESISRTSEEDSPAVSKVSPNNDHPPQPATQADNGAASWIRNPQAVAVMANLFAAAMTEAVSNMQPSNTTPPQGVDMAQFDRLFKEFMKQSQHAQEHGAHDLTGTDKSNMPNDEVV